MENVYNKFAGRSVERLCAISDGLFAVAMTLLLIEVHPPLKEAIHSEADLCRALQHMFPQLLMFLMGFLTLGIFWVGQQTQLNHFKESDRNLTWIHLTFLAVVSAVPFSTALLAEFPTYRTALGFYWLNVLLLGLFLLWSWRYGVAANLVKEDVPADVSKATYRRILAAQGLYALGAALCVFGNWWSIGFIFLMQLNYAVAPKIRGLFRI